MPSINLKYSKPEALLFLSEITGECESMISDTETFGAIRLIDRLILPDPVTGKAISANDLAAADRDRILAHIYKSAFGKIVASTVTCSSCTEPFEVEFDLDDMVAELYETSDERFRISEGVLFLNGNPVFRFPTFVDELDVLRRTGSEAREELLRRCSLGEGFSEEDIMHAAPLIKRDLEGICPECGALQHFHFDMQTFLLDAFIQERQRLHYEVHLLASTYRWSKREILELPRDQRRNYVTLIESEKRS